MSLFPLLCLKISLGHDPSGSFVNQRRMPVTRAGERLAGSEGIQPPPGFQTGLTEPGESAVTGGASADQATMDRDPIGLKDSLILKLRASVKSARKLIDNHILEVQDHIGTLTKPKDDPSIPADIVIDFSRLLQDLFTKGDN